MRGCTYKRDDALGTKLGLNVLRYTDGLPWDGVQSTVAAVPAAALFPGWLARLC
eukprot:CAMPEP_0173232542 /NCGR_PEP_ID=MMETSP1142-20121109/9051_1 /TAXON_ID=483371 /ORGANISM="non described non described, Strain CCMP2298" /LENGTH=53 /DNA_ID=CAMNT_0014162129 /DNA_START=426 /DNA_END=584 /DNA_ORIENTATION=+